MGGEGFEPPKAHANGFTVRPGSPTPASAHSHSIANLKASNKYIFIQIKMQINMKGINQVLLYKVTNVKST